jgi:hypothetical protein
MFVWKEEDKLIKLTRVFNKRAERVKNRKKTNIKFLLILLSIQVNNFLLEIFF